MKIVIDIPEEVYEFLQKNDTGSVVDDAVKNGTSLPKGHGRLIDADELFKYERANRKGTWLQETTAMVYKDLIRGIDNAPTIIEADKAESEDKV